MEWDMTRVFTKDWQKNNKGICVRLMNTMESDENRCKHEKEKTENPPEDELPEGGGTVI
jgi:hypothetical protein